MPGKASGNRRYGQSKIITALACSKAPEGYERWSLRLLADKAVELDIVENISYMGISRILKKTYLSHI